MANQDGNADEPGASGLELRRSVRQILINVFAPTTIILGMLYLLSPTRSVPINGGLTFIGLCVNGYFQLKAGIRLGETTARIRNFGTKEIPWSEIESVSVVDGKLGARRIALEVREPGTSTVLTAPWTGPSVLADPHFERQVETITAWWQAHRGATTPTPAD